MIGVKTLNGDIIYEKGGFFNVYFRQNAKLCKMADGHLFFCAKQTKIGGRSGVAPISNLRCKHMVDRGLNLPPGGRWPSISEVGRGMAKCWISV